MLEITVKTLDSQNHTFRVEDDVTVRGFKEHIAETVSVAAESQRLIYCGRVLQDDKKLNDYDVNGKVIHLVQRAPPQPESRSSNNDGQRQNNLPWPHGRVQYRGHVHRNAMYLGAMSVPAEVVEGPGLPTPQLSNTLSNSRLVSARCMLNKAIQLMDRLDDPSVPLHPSPTENNTSESTPQASAPEEETDQDSNLNSNINNTRDRMVQAASEMAAAFSAAALINIRLSHDDENGGNVAGSVNVIDPSQIEQTIEATVQPTESTRSEPERPDPQASEPKTSETKKVEKDKTEVEKPESSRSETDQPEAERSEPERNASTSNNNENQNTSRRSTPQVPRPPQMAELLERLVNTQDRLRPYIERYRVLMLADPSLTPGNGPEGVAENQRIVDGVSECLHYLSHACHALSDIIVDMSQQPPRNLRCRPIIIQHSAILQAGIPIQVESHINLSAPSTTNNNNTTDEGNEATRPSSPTSAASDQTNRSSNANNRSVPQSANNVDQPSSLGSRLRRVLLNLPSNAELSMELSPQSAMDLSSPNAADGTDNEQGQMGGPGGLYSMTPPFALISDALQSLLSERHSQMEASSGSTTNTPSNIPFVTIVGQQMDLGTPNSGQSTQARSNIGTHPTTSTQTRSTARPHVLHPHTHPLNMSMGMAQNMDFDPILPCNSHHIRRAPPATSNSTSTSQSNQTNQSTTSESHSRSQSASHSSTSARTVPHSVNIPIPRDLLENDGQALGNGIDINIVGGDLHISLIGNLPNASDVPLAEILRSLNVRLEEFTGRNFLIDLWLFMLRNVTFGGLMQLSLSQSGPLVNLRRPLREFLEHSFPDTPQSTLQERVVEQIVTLNRPYLQALIVPEVEAANRQIDIHATIEALLRKFCLEFLKLLFNNDLDDATFAQEAVTLARKLEDQSSAVLQHILEGGNTSLETIASRFLNQLTEGIHPFFQQTLLGILSTRIRAYATRTTQMSQSEITSLLVYKNQPSTPPAESAEPVSDKPQTKIEIQPEEEGLAQALPLQEQQSEEQQSMKKETRNEEKLELKPEAMETDALSLKKLDDSIDLNGEEIPESFPGAEHLPPEWVPIIAHDSVIQRRQTQLQTQQGGPIPFSDAYLSGLPSKRRKLIEQQKPQLLVSPTANTTAITASVERLVREGIGHTQLEEVEGAAHAVAAAPAVRNAFGQAIKDCIHPGRLRTPDFPNPSRFPNASKLFADKNTEQDAKTSATTATKSSK